MRSPLKEVETYGDITQINISAHPKESEITVLKEYINKMVPVVCKNFLVPLTLFKQPLIVEK
jgi:hypothetical protein